MEIGRQGGREGGRGEEAGETDKEPRVGLTKSGGREGRFGLGKGGQGKGRRMDDWSVFLFFWGLYNNFSDAELLSRFK